jgi:hypothetical protein
MQIIHAASAAMTQYKTQVLKQAHSRNHTLKLTTCLSISIC